MLTNRNLVALRTKQSELVLASNYGVWDTFFWNGPFEYEVRKDRNGIRRVFTLRF